MSKKPLQKLELTWIGKGDEPKPEPGILIEYTDKSYWFNKEKSAHQTINLNKISTIIC